MTYIRILTASLLVLTAGAGWMVVRAQDPVDPAFDSPVIRELPVSDPQCTFFGPQHDKFVTIFFYNFSEVVGIVR